MTRKTENDESLLWQAARDGDADRVRLLVARGVSVNVRGPASFFSSTPMMEIVARDDAALCELLVAHGADPALADSVGRIAIHVAAEQGARECAQLLLSHGADIEAKGFEGRAPLACAAWRGQLAMAAWLLDRGARADATDARGATALDEIVSSTTMEVERAELATRVVTLDPTHRRSAVERAVRYGNLPCVSALLTAEAMPSLVLAAQASRCSREMVELFLTHGASPNDPDAHGERPLNAAAESGNEETVALLLRAGASVDATGRGGTTALYRAASVGRGTVALRLVDAGADLEASDAEGLTPLMVALLGRHHATARMLVHGGADVRRRTRPAGLYQTSALLLALGDADDLTFERSPQRDLDLELVMAMLERGADPTERVRYGRTALHAALQHPGGKALVDVFVARGADLDAADDGGTTPRLLLARRAATT